jgi:hypothetical protein
VPLTEEEVLSVKSYGLMTLKPVFYVANVGENMLLREVNYHELLGLDPSVGIVPISAKIEAEFVDTHSKLVKQSIGDIISMDRNLCDPDRENHCSTGFHFAGYEYAKNFGGNAFIYVEVNPMNITAIPSDYNYQKGRCWPRAWRHKGTRPSNSRY